MRLLLLHLLCAAALVFLSGCGGSSPKLTAQDQQAFNSASPELKKAWGDASAFDKAGKFAEAGAIYFGLLQQQNLTADQLRAVQTAMASMNARMYEAASKGDAAAQKAIDSLTISRSRR